MSESSKGLNLKRETALAVVLLLVGVTLLPLAIWLVGSSVFGAYAGDGFGGFYAELLRRLAAGSGVAWFLVLSPLLGILAIRLTVLGFRVTGS